MKQYSKIETLFDRDGSFKVDTRRFRRIEYSFITSWDVTEKIDGMNVRIRYDKEGHEFNGRTDAANLNKDMRAILGEVADNSDHYARDIMRDFSLDSLTVFGELYGPKIQNGGRYGSSLAFAVFDMLINDSVWLDNKSVEFNCVRMGLDMVPNLGTMVTDDIVEMCRAGFVSVMSEDSVKNGLIAEGVIAKPPVPLYTQNGDRVIWKLKHKDF